MSFDINPLGPQTHLKQLERDVRRQHLVESAAKGLPAPTQHPDRATTGLLAWFTSLFITPRPAN